MATPPGASPLHGRGAGGQLAHRSARYRTEATRALRTYLPRLPADQITTTMARQAVEAIPKPAAPAQKSGGKGPPSVPALKGEARARRGRLRDFRRKRVSVPARLGVHWEVAGKVLNHTSDAIKSVAAIYQRYDFLAEREEALNIWAARVIKNENT